MTTRPSALPACWQTWWPLFMEWLRELEPLSLLIAALALAGTALSLVLTCVALVKQRRELKQQRLTREAELFGLTAARLEAARQEEAARQQEAGRQVVEAQERLEFVRKQGAGPQQAEAAKVDVESAKKWLEHIRRWPTVRAGQGPLLERMVRLGMDLEGINASGVSLYRANLANAKLRNADLTGADLTDAKLRETDLANAKLTGAKRITQEQLDAACGDPGPRALPDGLAWHSGPCKPRD